MKPLFKDSLTTIYCCKAEDILPKLPMSDLLLTDPPYGLNKSWLKKFHGSNGKTKLWGKVPKWDESTIDLRPALNSCHQHIVWGGNFYPLPPSRCWFVWDKLQSQRGADCELAWTDLSIAPKVFRMSRINAYENKRVFKKMHPAEKPIQLGLFCLKHANPMSVIDCYMGTGNFVVAARILEIPCIGIEQKEEYCEEAIARIKTKSIKHLSSEGLGIV